MARIKFFAGIDMYEAQALWGDVLFAGSHRITLAYDDYEATFRGNFRYGDDDSVDGKLKAFSLDHLGDTLLLAKGLRADAGGIYEELDVEGDAWGALELALSRKDVITGSADDDGLYGFGGNDLIRGRNGDDMLSGDDGRDKLFGGDGEDVLVGGAGSDRIAGGRGADVIVFNSTDGVDRVVQFAENDALAFDVTSADSDFFGLDKADIEIVAQQNTSFIYAEGDLVAKVHGADVAFDDILLI